tara:strand:- start:645 stop:1766 length:1122 start_codon:yes stop_codon:yes gene_type:complete
MITFSKKPESGYFLEAFNNNVFVFQSDSVETPLYCTIEMLNVTLEITPINGVFYFNAKEALSVYAFSEKFEDNERPIIGFQEDSDIAGIFDFDFTITFANASTESYAVSYNYTRGVQQINEIKKRVQTGLLCLPYLTAFRGYPFDFALYFPSEIANDKNGQTATESNSLEGARLFTSDGQTELSDFITRVSQIASSFFVVNNCCSVTPSFLDLGINPLRITNTQVKFTIELKDIFDGVYLKWINEFGTWNYWLFSSIYLAETQASTQSVYSVDYLDISETRTVELSTGKKAQDVISLNAQSLNDNEMKQVKSIFVSPRVELYNGVYNDNNDVADFKDFWQTVQVEDGSVLIKATKRNLVNVGFQISKNRYTQN